MALEMLLRKLENGYVWRFDNNRKISDDQIVRVVNVLEEVEEQRVCGKDEDGEPVYGPYKTFKPIPNKEKPDVGDYVYAIVQAKPIDHSEASTHISKETTKQDMASFKNTIQSFNEQINIHANIDRYKSFKDFEFALAETKIDIKDLEFGQIRQLIVNRKNRRKNNLLKKFIDSVETPEIICEGIIKAGEFIYVFVDSCINYDPINLKKFNPYLCDYNKNLEKQFAAYLEKNFPDSSNLILMTSEDIVNG